MKTSYDSKIRLVYTLENDSALALENTNPKKWCTASE